jgi:hypothetical protein
MVCFRYIIVNIQHKGDNKDNNNNNNNNNKFCMGVSITCGINGNHRIAATLYTLDTSLFLGTELKIPCIKVINMNNVTVKIIILIITYIYVCFNT